MFHRAPIDQFRNDAFSLTLAITGFDMTGCPISFAVKERPDAPDAPLLLATDEDGVDVVEVIEDEDGVPTSLIEITRPKEMIQALPVAFFDEEVVLAYDLKFKLPDGSLGSFSTPEQTYLVGDFRVLGSVAD